MVICLNKGEHYKLKKYNFFLKVNIKMGKKMIIKFGDVKIQKQKFHQHKRPFSIKNVDLDKIVVIIESLLVKQNLNSLLSTKMINKLNLYAYFYQKCLPLEKSLMKLNLCLF